MQNITVVNTELTLIVKQVTNNIVYATSSLSLKGSGNSKNSAITNSISKIPVTDQSLKTFIETAKAKIIVYYQENCNDIEKKAEVLAKNQNYEAALGTLMAVPEEVSSCYNQVLSRSMEIYKAYQNQKCSVQVQQAEVLLAAKDYTGALTVIGQIDPSASCFNAAEALAKSAADKVDEESKKQWDFKMKQYDNAVALEKQRIDAIKDIAVSYFNSQPKTINNTLIVR
jgi:tetratricopeptide (TPR) repeat protein